MSLPLLPIVTGGVGVAAGAAIHAWLTGDPDTWADRITFNSRMRDMHRLALALNNGFSTCQEFLKSQPQLIAWRGVRDNYGKFFGDVGVIEYTYPSRANIDTAKDYASKFYFWLGEYERWKCGHKISPKVTQYATPAGETLYPSTTNQNKKPNQDTLYPALPAPPADLLDQNWGEILKWAAIGIGGLITYKLIADSRKGR